MPAGIKVIISTIFQLHSPKARALIVSETEFHIKIWQLPRHGQRPRLPQEIAFGVEAITQLTAELLPVEPSGNTQSVIRKTCADIAGHKPGLSCKWLCQQ